ncbi:hypothetical protein, partial [Candidatus Avelusimicrobium faecicola]|uniref:hypothetical protein n=1 Tax=Candidatus Avelusimicrobium faecicola TaxID=3416205 RepID=UPI003D1430C6
FIEYLGLQALVFLPLSFSLFAVNTQFRPAFCRFWSYFRWKLWAFEEYRGHTRASAEVSDRRNNNEMKEIRKKYPRREN